MNITREEHGWPAHFLCAKYCGFRRNTHLVRSDDNVRIVVSTVGRMTLPNAKEPEDIGLSRYYETMVFSGIKIGAYWEADIDLDGLSFNSKWSIDHVSDSSDNEADAMHEAVVAEFTARLEAGETFKTVNDNQHSNKHIGEI